MSISASLMIIIVLLFRAIIKNRIPWYSYAVMWYIVIIRLLIPFRITVTLSLSPNTLSNSFFSPVQSSLPMSILSSSQGTEQIIAANNGITVNFFNLIKVIWLIGILLLSVYFIYVYIRYNLKLKSKIEITDSINLVNNFKTIRKIRIYKCSNLPSPLTCGIIVPKIIIPSETDTSDLTTLRYIICHEYIHIKRFDSLTKILIVLSLCLHWFNPAVWLFFIYANRDLEISCDEKVINIFGSSKKHEYASVLIKMEEVKANKASSLYSYFNTNIIKERIIKIMNSKKKSNFSKVMAVVLVTVNTVVFSVSPAIVSAHEVKSNELAEDIKPVFIWPAENCEIITSPYGKNELNGTFHDHIDISGDKAAGSAVYASDGGIVEETGFDAVHGNYIIINHENGYKTFYGHCEELKVSINSSVNQGDTIATIGKTGSATGYFLSFGIISDSEYINPMNLL